MNSNQLFERLDIIRTLMGDGNTVKAASELDWLVVQLKQQKDQILLDRLPKID